MRAVDLIVSFELEINKLDETLTKPVTDDSLYWINQAVLRFVKRRFHTSAISPEVYEQTEKRTRDLVNLFKEKDYYIADATIKHKATYDSFEFDYPSDMMFVLNEDVEITDLDGGHPLDTCVFECTADSFMYRITNSLTDFHYRKHRARPLRIRTNDGFRLLTDKNYKISNYTLGYLRVPTEITSEDPDKEYTDFPNHIWPEITKMAAQMYIENQKDPRYQTISAEVSTQE